MRILVGSKNPAKVDAVREILQDYPHLKDAEVVGFEFVSDLPEQPRTLEETSNGAVARAKGVFNDCDYSVGIEAGFMQVPNAKSGYMNVTVAAIYDGTELHIGMSSAFETPDTDIMRMVVEDGMNLNDAAISKGLSTPENAGKNEGVIGTITNGRLPRKEYVMQALQMALIHIDQ